MRPKHHRESFSLIANINISLLYNLLLSLVSPLIQKNDTYFFLSSTLDEDKCVVQHLLAYALQAGTLFFRVIEHSRKLDLFCRACKSPEFLRVKLHWHQFDRLIIQMQRILVFRYLHGFLMLQAQTWIRCRLKGTLMVRLISLIKMKGEWFKI